MQVVDIEEPLRAPKEPTPEECCGSGCARCVWDVYFDKVAEYEALLKSGKTSVQRNIGSPKVTAPLSRDGSISLKYLDDFDEVYERPKVRSDGTLIPSPLWGRSEFFKASFCAGGLDSLGTGLRHSRLKLATVAENTGTSALSSWMPGSTVDVFVPNDGALVDKLLERLGLDGERKLRLMESPFVSPGSFPPWLPQDDMNDPNPDGVVAVRELLSNYVDISSIAVLRSQKLYQLLENSAGRFSPQEDKETASRLSIAVKAPLNESGAAEIKALVDRRGNLVDVLSLVPSISPPLARLLEVLPRLRERKFSCCNVACPETSMGPEIFFRVIDDGHASGPMGKGDPVWVKPPWLSGLPKDRFEKRKDAAAMSVIETATNPNTTFVKSIRGIPCSSPLILVGAGTGLAPLRSILQWRLTLVAAPTILITSFKHPRDNVFDVELRRYAEKASHQLHYFPFYTGKDVAPTALYTKGRVDECFQEEFSGHLQRVLPLPANENKKPVVVCCGPNIFMDSIKKLFSSFFEAEPGGDAQWNFIREQWSSGA